MLPPPPHLSGDADLSENAILLDGLTHWLPNQILNKMDQLSMAHGVEARVPFLDTRIWDLLIRVPAALMLDGGNKTLLRRAMARERIANADRPKHAFHLPVEGRRAGALAAMARAWLSGDQIRRFGVLKEPFVQRQLAALERGEFLASKRVVAMTALHMWLDANRCAL